MPDNDTSMPLTTYGKGRNFLPFEKISLAIFIYYSLSICLKIFEVEHLNSKNTWYILLKPFVQYYNQGLDHWITLILLRICPNNFQQQCRWFHQISCIVALNKL